MRRALTLFFALLPPCAACLCALALAAPARTQSATDANGATERAGRARRPPAQPTTRWAKVDSVPGLVGASPLPLRRAAGALAPVAEEADVSDYPHVEVLETAGEFLRVRFRTGGEGGRSVEGWAAWGAALPATTALVLDARDGRVLRRVALGPGIDAVAFSADGARALFHGRWASAVYEADASDLVPTRRLEADLEGSFGPASYTGAGRELLVTFWGTSEGRDGSNSSLYLARAGGGGMTMLPAAVSPKGAEPAMIVFAPDGRAGFAFYAHPYGDEHELPAEEDRGAVATVEVFDPATMQPLRRFKLPSAALAFDAGSVAVNADGSELYLLDHQGQRLVVVETQVGGVVREVSLSGETQRSFMLAQPAASGAGPLVRYWEAGGGEDEHHSTPGTLRLEGHRAVASDLRLAFTAEAGGIIYAVDDAGARLYAIGDDGRPRVTRELQGPEGLQTPVGLFATPDGSRLILLLAVPEDGC
jgi:dipeptidyl aminopeptidase/acylaminoacyl peptidase